MATELGMQAADVLGAGAVFPERAPIQLQLPEDMGKREHFAYRCASSPAKDLLPSRRVRRLGRAQELALAAAHHAVRSCPVPPGIEDGGAVCLGTGWGELGNTADFLEDMIDPEKLAPKPTHFINSVHNSLASEIAIDFQALEANHTFTHGAISFETALAESIRMLWRRRARCVLLAGVDKLTPYLLPAGFGLGSWRLGRGPLAPMETSPDGPHGTLPGEGAAAFVLVRGEEDLKDERFARIAAVHVRPLRSEDIIRIDAEKEKSFIETTLDRCGLSLAAIDLALSGANGDPALDATYRRVFDAISASAGRPLCHGVYKHGCGEFATASALGLILAIHAVQEGDLPDAIRVLDTRPMPRRITNVLLYHLSPSGYHSACVVTA